jgi:hypothetical protein
MRHLRRRAVLLALTLAVSATPVAAADGPRDRHGGITPATHVKGATGGELLGDLVAQLLALPASANPLSSPTDLCLRVGRHGRVLAPIGGSPEVECTVEVGTPVFITGPWANCSSAEPPPFFGATEAEQRACAIREVGLGRTFDRLEVRLDDRRPVDILNDRFFLVSPQEETVFPANPAFEARPGPATFVVAGYAVLIRKLRVGTHTVVFRFSLGGAETDMFSVTLHVVRDHDDDDDDDDHDDD